MKKIYAFLLLFSLSFWCVLTPVKAYDNVSHNSTRNMIFSAELQYLAAEMAPDVGGGGNSNKPIWASTSKKASCGGINNIPAQAMDIVSLVILILQVAVPVLLVLFGVLDFTKGIMAQKEDEIKKGQQTFIKRLIMGALVFFIVALVKLLVNVMGDNDADKKSIISCIDCFVNGSEKCNVSSSSGSSGGGGGGGLNVTEQSD